jgi:AhpD family alkylhydroperoxidase
MLMPASQINGCAYCIVMHTNDARKHGESDEWMHLPAAVIAINAWNRAAIAFRATPQLTSAKIAA